MANRESAFIEITPEVLIKAYSCGIFPMADMRRSSRCSAL
jgi:leucyl/phenylalanyl-tRNA---protein transferase